QRTPLTSRSSEVGVSSAGRGSPQRSTTGVGAAAHARTPAGVGGASARRGSVVVPAGRSPSSPVSKVVQEGEAASGASTVATASGPVSGDGASGPRSRAEIPMPATTTASSSGSATAMAIGADGRCMRLRSAQVHDRAGQRAGDPANPLYPRDHELTQLVDVVGLGAHDHVVRPGDVLGREHPADPRDLGGHGGGLAHLGLHKDVGLHHGVPLSAVDSRGRSRMPNVPEEDALPDDRRTIAMVGEFGLIDQVTRDRVQPATTVLGPGDDAAVVAASDGRVVATTDVLVADVHFRLDWSTPEQVGRKAAAANLADVAQMGAVPTALLVGLAAPPDTPVATLTGLADGLWAEASAVGAGLVGGDVVTSATLTLAVTALGSLEGRPPVTRAGARPGDVVALAGRVGWAAAGFAVLQRGFRSPDRKSVV